MITVRVMDHDCCPFTHSIWINLDLPKKTKLSQLGLDSKDFADDRKPDNLIKALKAQGFKHIKDEMISFGGNY